MRMTNMNMPKMINLFAVKHKKNARANGPCYNAEVNESNKFRCPECKTAEAGTLRVITHNYNCSNKGKHYCQNKNGVLGGSTRKARKNRRNVSRRR